MEAPRALHHYTLSSGNASHATSTERGLAGTYSSDLYVSPLALGAALAHVVHVNGSAERYRFRDFKY